MGPSKPNHSRILRQGSSRRWFNQPRKMGSFSCFSFPSRLSHPHGTFPTHTHWDGSWQWPNISCLGEEDKLFPNPCQSIPVSQVAPLSPSWDQSQSTFQVVGKCCESPFASSFPLGIVPCIPGSFGSSLGKTRLGLPFLSLHHSSPPRMLSRAILILVNTALDGRVNPVGIHPGITSRGY